MTFVRKQLTLFLVDISKASQPQSLCFFFCFKFSHASRHTANCGIISQHPSAPTLSDRNNVFVVTVLMLFYWLRFKNSNHIHSELSLGYLKDTEFYRKSKAFFIHTSSIASFKPFLIVWWWEYSFKSSPWPKYTQYGTIFPKKSCSTIKLFFFFKHVIY